MEERNSEAKPVWLVITLAVLGALAGVADALMETGVFDQWPAVGLILGGLVAAAVVAGVYASKRPLKHIAMAERVKADAQLTAAQALNKPSEPSGK